MDVGGVARELAEAYANKRILPVPLSSREAEFDLDAAYAVEAELTRMRRASGRTTVGRKVGYANKAVWRALKLETLVWAHMYDDTVTMADGNQASLPIGSMVAPKIEPEIVFKLRRPVNGAGLEAAAILEAVDWMAIGFEIVDSIYAGWKFQPSDFVAAYGIHAALVVGEPRPLDPGTLEDVAAELSKFPVRLLRDGQPVAEGSGRNCLRSPALCLGELAAAISRRQRDEPLAAGELVSTGTLTEAQPIEAGQTWTVSSEGLGLDDLTVQTMG